MSSSSSKPARPTATSQPVEGTVFHGDGREPALLEHLQSRASELQGNSDAVLEAIDKFGETQYLMNVGKHKVRTSSSSRLHASPICICGTICWFAAIAIPHRLSYLSPSQGEEVEKVISDRKPLKVLELGTYVGYSSLRFARHIERNFPDAVGPDEWSSAKDGQQKAGYICLEYNPEYAKVARGVLDIGGVGKFGKVSGSVSSATHFSPSGSLERPCFQIIVGSSTESIGELRETLSLGPDETFDFLFLDHLKPLYTPDLQLLESLGLVGPGTTIVADNVVKPGSSFSFALIRSLPHPADRLPPSVNSLR
jgi:catechol O-methyltransferase